MEKIAKKTSATEGGSTDLKAGQWQRAAPNNDHFGDEHEPLLSCWQAIDGRKRLVLSRDGKLLAASQGASHFFAWNDALAGTGHFTLACKPSCNEQLQNLLKAKVGVVETVALPKASGEGHYVISAVGLSATAVAIAIHEADESFVPIFADFEAVFELTHCEVLVVERLMRGYCAQRIADDLDISVHTVRAHLRHCYDKLGVSSREQLWKRLAPYRLN
ncbi:MAG: helix-turn-helix domain-containing protein [Rhodospirillales bacterium]|nr:helix-turn-helix domain-containing protein [Rhodospirillales bacterium]